MPEVENFDPVIISVCSRRDSFGNVFVDTAELLRYERELTIDQFADVFEWLAVQRHCAYIEEQRSNRDAQVSATMKGRRW